LPVSSTGWALRRLNLATTNQDGIFTFSGLPDGEYRMGAVAHFDISGSLGQERITTKTGDRAVRIVFATPGTLVGRVTLSGSQAAPKAFTVQLSPGSGMPTGSTDGAFEYRGIAPGVYTVIFRSTELADLVLRNVEVETARVTDLGTVVVTRGRQLAGKVVDEVGAPIPGAQIKIVIQAASPGSGAPAGDFESLFGFRSAVADRLGMFTINGVPERVGVPVTSMTVVAYDPDRGSSGAIAIPEGKDDPPQVTLLLGGAASSGRR
jgi:hypothetical protein